MSHFSQVQLNALCSYQDIIANLQNMLSVYSCCKSHPHASLSEFAIL